MANIYVRSTDGSNTDDGSTWALAKLDLAGAAAIDSAGDTIFVSDNHAESTAAAITIALAGTHASPTKVVCGDDAAEPPTAVATSGTVTTTGANDITITGTAYIFGLSFVSGMAINLAGNADTTLVLDNCSLQTTNTGSAGVISFYAANNQVIRIKLKDTTFKFNATNNIVRLGGNAVIEGGSVLAGGTTPTSMFGPPSGDRTGGTADISGFDFSNLGSSFNIFSASGATSFFAVVRNCKLPAGWSGSLVSGTLEGLGQRYEMHNCDSGDTNYRLRVEDYAGSINHETTVVRTGGASDGTTTLSWKMTTSSNAEYPVAHLESPEIVQWNETTGSSVTASIEIVHDSQGAGSGSAFQDDEIWLEVMYLGTSGYPLGTWTSDAKADVLAAAADQTSSSETWTTTGLTTPVKQKLSVTFTPQEKGFIHARVVMAKASKTCYVDPLLTVA